jgi:hypothetical protein
MAQQQANETCMNKTRFIWSCINDSGVPVHLSLYINVLYYIVLMFAFSVCSTLPMIKSIMSGTS